MSNTITMPFTGLAVGSSFTFAHYPAFVWKKVSATEAQMVGCSDPTEMYVDLCEADFVRPFWSSGCDDDLDL